MDYEKIIGRKNIWIYGYSNLGRNAYNRLLSLYPDQVKGILVSKINKRCRENKSICEIKNVRLKENTIIFIATNTKFHNSIRENIKNYGNVDIHIYDKHLDNWLLKKLKDIPLLETKFMALSVGQACNFKCKDCANFAPYAKAENMRYNLKNIKRDIEKIFSYFSEIDTFHIQGGEPFLYTELAEILQFLYDKYQGKVHNIQIATNGAIKPSQEVINIIKQNIFSIRISNYGIDEQTDKNIKETIRLLDKNGINYRKYDFVGRKGEWTQAGEIDYEAPPGENVYEKVTNCSWCSCYTVENGMVGRCARSIPARSLQKLEIKEKDYLILTEDISIEIVGKYFMFIEPMDCCKHCKGTKGENIKAAIQIQ